MHPSLLNRIMRECLLYGLMKRPDHNTGGW